MASGPVGEFSNNEKDIHRKERKKERIDNDSEIEVLKRKDL